MNQLRKIGLRRRRSLPLLGLIALLLGLPAPPGVLAHPLDEYLQATYITVAPTQIVVELDLTPGVLVAPQVLPELDPDGNQEIVAAEGQAYADAVLRNMVLDVDGQSLALAITRIDMPTYLNIQAGYGTIRIFTAATLADDMTGTHSIAWRNDYAPTKSVYQVNAFVEKGDAITLGKQNRDRIQQSMTMDFAIGSALPAEAVPVDSSVTAPVGVTGQEKRLQVYLDAPSLSPRELLLAVALAVVLGGLHALTPGHGKALVAAYLVGSRGTVRHAIALGGIVTFTHTASVIAIGALALVATQYVVPNVLVPVLEIGSGVLVVSLGARLVWRRWAVFQRRDSDGAPTHDHGHSHDHEHIHDHAHSHDHGDGHTHSHLPPVDGVRLGSLIAMGISGGLVPCPEALGVMIIAIGLNRIVLGLGLIVSFSVGLAAVLMVIGILLVRSRSLVERFGGLSGHWSTGLQLGSAAVVTLLGLGMTLNGLASVLG